MSYRADLRQAVRILSQQTKNIHVKVLRQSDAGATNALRETIYDALNQLGTALQNLGLRIDDLTPEQAVLWKKENLQVLKVVVSLDEKLGKLAYFNNQELHNLVTSTIIALSGHNIKLHKRATQNTGFDPTPDYLKKGVAEYSRRSISKNRPADGI